MAPARDRRTVFRGDGNIRRSSATCSRWRARWWGPCCSSCPRSTRRRSARRAWRGERHRADRRRARCGGGCRSPRAARDRHVDRRAWRECAASRRSRAQPRTADPRGIIAYDNRRAARAAARPRPHARSRHSGAPRRLDRQQRATLRAAQRRALAGRAAGHAGARAGWPRRARPRIRADRPRACC